MQNRDSVLAYLEAQVAAIKAEQKQEEEAAAIKKEEVKKQIILLQDMLTLKDGVLHSQYLDWLHNAKGLTHQMVASPPSTIDWASVPMCPTCGFYSTAQSKGNKKNCMRKHIKLGACLRKAGPPKHYHPHFVDKMFAKGV